MTEVSRVQGILMGRLADVGMALRDQACLITLTEDVVKTSEIEGVLDMVLNPIVNANCR